MHKRLNLQLDILFQSYRTTQLMVGEERNIIHAGEIEAMLV